MIPAGELRCYVTIEKPTVSNTSGEAVTAWTIWRDKVPASITPLTTREYWLAVQAQSDITHRITIRYLEGLKSNMRIKWNGRVFNLLGPPRNLEEANEVMELLCREVELP